MRVPYLLPDASLSNGMANLQAGGLDASYDVSYQVLLRSELTCPVD